MIKKTKKTVSTALLTISILAVAGLFGRFFKTKFGSNK